MWIILKTFKLSKNSLVHLFYLILIVTTVSSQTDEEPAGQIPMQTDEKTNNAAEGTDPIPMQTDEKTNNAAEGTDPIPSKMDKESTINDGQEEKESTIGGILRRMRSMNTPTNENEKEMNNIGPKESNMQIADNNIKDQELEVENEPFGKTTLGLNPEDFGPEKKKIEAEDDNKEETTESKKNKKRKRTKKKTSESITEQDDNENDLQTEPEEMEGLSETPIENTKGASGSTTTGGLELEENKKEAEPDQNNNEGIKSSKRKKKKRKTTGSIAEHNENDLQTEPEEMEGLSETPIENTKGTSESTTTGGLELEENKKEAEPDQNINEGITSSKQKSEITPYTEDTQHPLEPIDPKDLTLSPLDKVEIKKIKGKDLDKASELIRKQKKRNIYKEFTPTEGKARIYCTFLGDVSKMHKKVAKRFVGHFCHAIVFGTPIILKNHRVHLSENIKHQLHGIHLHKEQSLIIVIMQYSDYLNWVPALQNKKGMKKLVIDIVHTVKHYRIDGIQFSNLHPTTGTDQIDVPMMTKLLKFIEKLQSSAISQNHNLKIGITIDMDGLPITKSFTSFRHINSLVTWYSFKTISMVTCSSDFKTTGTTPLEGNIGFKTAINSIIDQINYKNDFEMEKLVVGIQLFPSKENDLFPYTYEDLCSTSKDEWGKWCIMEPEDFRLKGLFLRGTQIGGLQLYYMHSDDYRSSCGCFSFPLIRALLRGLIKIDNQEKCNFETADNKSPVLSTAPEAGDSQVSPEK